MGAGDSGTIASSARFGTASRATPPRGDFFALPGDFVQRYIWVATYVRGARVLESGSDFGAGASYLAEHGARTVLGLVSDRPGVEYAERRYGRSNLRFDVAEAVDGGLPSEAFDVVVSFGVLEHTSDPEAYLGGLRDALRPGGRCFLATTNPRFRERTGRSAARQGHPFIREYEAEELAGLVSRFFDIQGLYGQTRLVDHEANPADDARPSARRRASNAVRQIVGQPFRSRGWKLRRTTKSPDAVGTWREFVIEDVRNPAAYAQRYPVQLVRCVRRSRALPTTANSSGFQEG